MPGEDKKNHIVEENGKFKLLSHTGKNLGTFDTRQEAEKHEGEVEYFKHKDNATEYPSFYYARHIGGGLVGYEDETLHVSDATLKEMMPSFVGKPVVVLHQPIELNNLEKKDGTIIESFYNDVDGRFWVKFMVETDKARAAINQGHSVSNCYQPTQYGGAGMHNNVPYTRSMEKGYYKHLAIVPNPRYEEAQIFTLDEFKNYQEKERKKLTELHNSKEQKKMKFWKSKKEEVSHIDEDTMLTLESGKDISIKEMINAVENAKKNESDEEEEKKKKEKEEEKVNMDSEIMVGESKMPIKELVNKYNKMMKNAESEKEKADKENKKNVDEEEEEKKKKEEKENGIDHFTQLMNAGAELHKEVIRTTGDGLALAKELYGSN